MEGQDWNAELVSTTDGDTFRAVLRRTERRQVAPGWWQDLLDYSADDAGNPDDVPLRLIIVDTPERGKPRFQEARADLMAWLVLNRAGLRVITYRSAGWDRLLVDAWAWTRGNTASQHMLGLGWPPHPDYPTR